MKLVFRLMKDLIFVYVILVMLKKYELEKASSITRQVKKKQRNVVCVVDGDRLPVTIYILISVQLRGNTHRLKLFYLKILLIRNATVMNLSTFGLSDAYC